MLHAHGGTAPAILARLRESAAASLANPEVGAKLNAQGLELQIMKLEEMVAFNRAEIAKRAELVRRSGAQVDWSAYARNSTPAANSKNETQPLAGRVTCAAPPANWKHCQARYIASAVCQKNQMSNLRALSPSEIRVLGVLSEKQRTVPDSYPLTLHSLVSGCNQKTSRNPIIEMSDAEAQAALDSLKALSLVTESSGGRVYRYGHNLDGVLKIPSQSIVLLTVLMLRGAQTPGELRIASERMHNFADVSSVEGFLNELADRTSGALVRKLARLAGARESRWTHLLGGEPTGGDIASPREARSEDFSLGEVAALKAHVARLEGELEGVKALLGKVCSELGIDRSS